MRKLLSVGALLAASMLTLGQPKPAMARHYRERVIVVQPRYHHHHHHYRYRYYPYGYYGYYR
jgi:hypothetical protein